MPLERTGSSTTPEPVRERAFSLATLPATPSGRRLALAVVAVSTGIFAALIDTVAGLGLYWMLTNRVPQAGT